MAATLRTTINKLKDAYSTAKSKEIDLNAASSGVGDFKGQKEAYVRNTIVASIKDMRNAILKLSSTTDITPLIKLHKELEDNRTNPDIGMKIVDKLAGFAADIDEPQQTSMKIKTPFIPEDIRNDMVADIEEMNKCFDAGCYRSSTILCGRILETVLHRKYFDVTGKDILETNPGIGLGTLIAKLNDKNVAFDPGLTQQIHLINQVRIFSVHKKQESFLPSKPQAQAMILYTMDVLEKVFRK